MGPPNPIVTTIKEEEYEVESILRHPQWGGAMEYLVNWYGYDEADGSWVSEQDLVHTH